MIFVESSIISCGSKVVRRQDPDSLSLVCELCGLVFCLYVSCSRHVVHNILTAAVHFTAYVVWIFADN